MVPGVSGGTIALLVGVYAELVGSIQAATSRELLRVLRPGGLAAYWRAIHGWFLLALGLGIATAILSLAKVISHLLQAYPVLVWAFFFGLIVASILLIARRVPRWSLIRVGLFAVGTAAGATIALAGGINFLSGPLGNTLAGALAICAMILPGISGSFILLLLGKYAAIIEAVHRLDVGVLLPFAGGALVGLLSFSHLLSWLLRRWEHATLALLLGFMTGSMPRVWPWHTEKADGAIQLLSPAQYAALGLDSMLLWAGLCAALGAGIVVLIEWLSARKG